MPASLLPGYVLLAARIRGKAQRPDVDAMLGEIKDVPATRVLSDAGRELGELTSEAEQLRKRVREVREGLEGELRFRTAGIGKVSF